MNPQTSSSEDLTQPVAYDADGRPLYHHPPQTGRPAPVVAQTNSYVTARPKIIDGENFDPRLRSQYANEPQVVHVARDIDPKPFTISDDLKQKHEKSVQQYPNLNLSEGEYIILDIKRHPIGMLIPTGISVFLVVMIMVFVMFYPSIARDAIISPMPSLTDVFGVAMLLIGLVALGGAVSLWIYLQNHFYMTNESNNAKKRTAINAMHYSLEEGFYVKNGYYPEKLEEGTLPTMDCNKLRSAGSNPSSSTSSISKALVVVFTSIIPSPLTSA
jgi:hypothetical protein